MNKLLLHLVAKNCQKSALVTHLQELANELISTLDLADAKATVMLAHDDDPMRATGDARPLPVAFDASLEVKTSATDAFVRFEKAVKGLLNKLDVFIHADLSAIQAGVDIVFVAADPTAIRFQYCMRRRADFSNTDYLQRYEDIHSAFGLGTKGIEGYVQFHIDQAASKAIAQAAGFGVSQVDSVSELHIDTMEKFLEGISQGIEAGDPGEDEDKFVDRPHSVMWVSDEIYRLGY
ncbi:MAG: EthD domain-containing protein [Pseudomonadales bacterium]